LLLRLPYGPSDPVERFGFEEMPTARTHGAYSWGSSAFAAVLLLARSFRERGWDMQPGDHLEIDDLPTEIYVEDGERKLLACAEVFLSERSGEAILQRGLCPLLSYKNRNAARLLRFQSLADPPTALRGPWG
jgi:type VI secretion system protein ImpC